MVQCAAMNDECCNQCVNKATGRLLALCFMVIPLYLSPAIASAQMISSQDPASIAKLLRDRGQTAIVTVDEFNDPFIETSVDNVDYNIIFYGCTEHEACTSLSLRAQRMSSGRASFEAMNNWNTEQRWTKLYTADVNSAILEMDFLFHDEAMSRSAFAAYLDIWDRSVAEFVRFIDDGDYEFVD